MYSSTIFIFLFISATCSFVLPGEYVFEELNAEWSFAYNLVSNTSVQYNTTRDIRPQDHISVTGGYKLRDSSIGMNIFAVPFIAYPIVFLYNIPSLLDEPLNMPEYLFAEIYQESNVTVSWNDPRIVQYNPSLEGLDVPIQMIVNRDQSDVNTFLISRFFGEDIAMKQNGTWEGIVGGVPQALGFPAVLGLLNLYVNTATFVPLPDYLAAPPSAKIKPGSLMIGNEGDVLSKVDYEDLFRTSFKRRADILEASVVPAKESWPLQMYLYVAFNQQPVNSDCIDSRDGLRYFYWVFKNQYLKDPTDRQGFRFLDDDAYETTKQFILTANCSGDIVLSYTNISEDTRTNALFAVTVVFVSLFIILIMVCWYFNSNRHLVPVIANHAMVVLGLILSMVSYVLWWYAPSTTALCETRYWFIGVGYTCVVSAIYGYAIVIYIVHSKKAISSHLVSSKSLFLGYLAIQTVEIIILILRTVISKPKSVELVTNPLKWETIYTCTVENRVLDLIQYIFFAVVSLGICFVLYRFLSEKAVQDRIKWLLLALFSTMMIFVQLIIITEILELSDNQMYVIVTSMFLFAEANIVAAYFLPYIWSKFRDRSSSGSGTKATTTITSGHRDNIELTAPPAHSSEV